MDQLKSLRTSTMSGNKPPSEEYQSTLDQISKGSQKVLASTVPAKPMFYQVRARDYQSAEHMEQMRQFCFSRRGAGSSINVTLAAKKGQQH